MALDEKYSDLFYGLIVFLFGGYLVVLYYGHQAVPNSDFSAFFKTGQQILSFQLPSSYKRLPGLGVFQVLLSHLMSGPHPGLTAGFVLNGILYVGTGVFFYLAAKQILGKAAIWYALLVLVNPQGQRESR